MRGEELSHLELLLRFGILVVAGKVGLFEVVQPSDTGIAVVDALRRNEVLAGVYGEKYLLVDFSARIPCGICWGMMAYMTLSVYR